MLAGKKKKDYAAESAANALETQAETLGMEPRSPDDEDDDESTDTDDAIAAELEPEEELVAA